MPDPKDTPNAETIASFKEIEEGGGDIFEGSTEAIFEEILKEEDDHGDGQALAGENKLDADYH